VRSLRVTGGALKGRKVALPPHGPGRYTAAKVREALFNLVGPIEGLTILDLFAGSGSVAIEAMSRGAMSATLIEQDNNIFQVMEKNLGDLLLFSRVHTFNMDARAAIPFLHERHYTYDMIFLDPPYGAGLLGESMALLSQYPLDSPETVFILEHWKKDCLSAGQLAGFTKTSEKRYGDTLVTLLIAETAQRRSI
jgi:16S rRNA (guanine966-N2)-methyltransferase